MTEQDQTSPLLPSEKARAKAENDLRQRELQQMTVSLLREDFGRTFQTAHGQRVLAWLAARCGWGKPPLAADKDGKIDMMMTTHNAMELSLYLAMRQFIPVDVLQNVEFGFVKPSGMIEGDQDTKPKKKKKG